VGELDMSQHENYVYVVLLPKHPPPPSVGASSRAGAGAQVDAPAAVAAHAPGAILAAVAGDNPDAHGANALPRARARSASPVAPVCACGACNDGGGVDGLDGVEHDATARDAAAGDKTLTDADAGAEADHGSQGRDKPDADDQGLVSGETAKDDEGNLASLAERARLNASVAKTAIRSELGGLEGVLARSAPASNKMPYGIYSLPRSLARLLALLLARSLTLPPTPSFLCVSLSDDDVTQERQGEAAGARAGGAGGKRNRAVADSSDTRNARARASGKDETKKAIFKTEQGRQRNSEYCDRAEGKSFDSAVRNERKEKRNHVRTQQGNEQMDTEEEEDNNLDAATSTSVQTAASVGWRVSSLATGTQTFRAAATTAAYKMGQSAPPPPPRGQRFGDSLSAADRAAETAPAPAPALPAATSDAAAAVDLTAKTARARAPPAEAAAALGADASAALAADTTLALAADAASAPAADAPPAPAVDDATHNALADATGAADTARAGSCAAVTTRASAPNDGASFDPTRAGADVAAAATTLAATTTLTVEGVALLTDGALAATTDDAADGTTSPVETTPGGEGAAGDGADATVEGAGGGSGSGGRGRGHGRGRGRGRGDRGRGSAHNSEQNQPDAAISVRLSQEAFVPRVTRSGGAACDSA